MSLIQQLKVVAYKILSNFACVTQKLKMPYDELGVDDLAILTGFKKSFFTEIGKATISLILLNEAKVVAIVDMQSQCTLKAQRAIRKTCYQDLKDNFETYSKKHVFTLLDKHICASLFAPLRKEFDLANA